MSLETAVIAYVNSKGLGEPAVSPEPMLFALVSGKLRKKLQSKTRYVALLMCLTKREVHRSFFSQRGSFSVFISGQTLPEGALEHKTECQGTSLIGSCPSEHKIAVKGVQYGTKLTSTCGLFNTSAGCCDYDDADCLVTYDGTAQQDACSAKALCLGISVAAADTSSCGTNYPVLNHYLTMEYYCVAGKLLSVLEEIFVWVSHLLQLTLVALEHTVILY